MRPDQGHPRERPQNASLCPFPRGRCQGLLPAPEEVCKLGTRPCNKGEEHQKRIHVPNTALKTPRSPTEVYWALRRATAAASGLSRLSKQVANGAPGTHTVHLRPRAQGGAATWAPACSSRSGGRAVPERCSLESLGGPCARPAEARPRPQGSAPQGAVRPAPAAGTSELVPAPPASCLHSAPTWALALDPAGAKETQARWGAEGSESLHLGLGQATAQGSQPPCRRHTQAHRHAYTLLPHRQHHETQRYSSWLLQPGPGDSQGSGGALVPELSLRRRGCPGLRGPCLAGTGICQSCPSPRPAPPAPGSRLGRAPRPTRVGAESARHTRVRIPKQSPRRPAAGSTQGPC